MISITIQGDKIIIEGLNKLASDIPEAIQSGLIEAVKGIHQNAKYFLHAEGAKGTYEKTKTGKFRWKKRDVPVSAGGYPVPIRSGTLGRSLKWLFPGQTESWGTFSDLNSRKVFKAGSVTAGPFEAIVFNIAPYAHVISEGTRTSAKYGPRPFLTDALKRFNEGDKLTKIMHENIEKAKKKAGF
jgi:hypothetical protein